MKKIQISKTTYDFKDMKVIVLDDEEGITNVYVEVAGDLRYVFGTDTAGFDKVDIEALHDNGYFDDFAYSDKAARFLKGEKIDE